MKQRYDPLPFFMVRAPLLPLECYHEVASDAARCYALVSSTAGGENACAALGGLPPSAIRAALHIASPSLSTALRQPDPDLKQRRRLLRYMIRMSTRPTPFGMFAGVGYGHWGSASTLCLDTGRFRTRTRLDMGWLVERIRELETWPTIRPHLWVSAHPALLTRSGRVHLCAGGTGAAGTTSVRAGELVRQALSLARSPIRFQDLQDALAASFDDAPIDAIAEALTELLRTSFLISDLRPPLLLGDPIRYVPTRLAALPAAHEFTEQLAGLQAEAARWDELPMGRREAGLASLAIPSPSSPGQTVSVMHTDMALGLRGDTLAAVVGTEVAWAAELLLRLSPLRTGPPALARYRQAFAARYGTDREVPLLDLLHPEYGLGPLSAYDSSPLSDERRVTARDRRLLELAGESIRDGRQVTELDPATLDELSYPVPDQGALPATLELYVQIAAPSLDAIDAGDFQVIVGPRTGTEAAGSSLGRFLDLLGPRASAEIREIADRERRAAPDHLSAELTYIPDQARLCNIMIHSAIHDHQIAFNTHPAPGGGTAIPVAELVVSMAEGRLCVYWPRAGVPLSIHINHLLNTDLAPDVCRFLSEVGLDMQCLLSPFDWGAAEGLPFLPRVQVGRIILAPARWHLPGLPRLLEGGCHAALPTQLAEWLRRWRVPRSIYLTLHDNRLLLDTANSDHMTILCEEIRSSRAGKDLVLEEVWPDLDHAWLEGDQGHYSAELVVPLQRRTNSAPSAAIPARSEAPLRRTYCPGERLSPPGGPWLYVKLYLPSSQEDDLLAARIPLFAERLVGSGLADLWFFVRYADPDPHLRLRFHSPERDAGGELMREALTWTQDLLTNDRILRVAVDTYDREIERYGGPHGIAMAESVFHADSCAVAELLGLCGGPLRHIDRRVIAALSCDRLLTALGLPEASRLLIYRACLADRSAGGTLYREQKTALWSVFATPEALCGPAAPLLTAILDERGARLVPLVDQIRDLGRHHNPGDQVLYGSFLHMHCNRLLGVDLKAEQMTYGLLLRYREGMHRRAARDE